MIPLSTENKIIINARNNTPFCTLNVLIPQFATVYLPILQGIVTEKEFNDSLQIINKASNRGMLQVRIYQIFNAFVIALGIFCLIQAFYTMVNKTFQNSLPAVFIVLIACIILAILFRIAITFQTHRNLKITVDRESLKYYTKKVTWTLKHESYAFWIEIDIIETPKVEQVHELPRSQSATVVTYQTIKY